MLDILWIALFLVLVIGIPYVYSKKGVRFSIGIAYVVGVVVFAKLFYEYQGIKAVLSSFVFSAQLFTFGVNGKELVEMFETLRADTGIWYLCCVWAAFLICPVLTVSVLLTYIKKTLDRIKLKTRLFKDVYIFTSKCQNAEILAQDICASNKCALVVFADSDGEDAGGKILSVCRKPAEIASMLNGTNNINLCINDADTGEILDKLNKFLENDKIRNKKTKIFIFSDNPIAHEVVDGIKKTVDNHIQIISTNAILMREILWDYPLFSNMHSQDELNVTVLGVGDFGGYFAMNTLWCATLPDCRLKLNLVDTDKEENILRRVSANIPKDYFDIEVFSENVNTNCFFDKISGSRLKNSDYILVAMGNDDLNISISRKVRLHFARWGKNPFIMTVLKNQSKFAVMKETLAKEGIVVTGGAENIYSYERMFNDRFFPRAFEVFKIVEKNYGNDVTVADFYRQNQIDIFSSYANAVHCKYKVFSLTGVIEPRRVQIESALNEKMDKIVSSEHNRWVAFELLKGYVGIDKDELPQFFENNKSTGKIHKNEVLKMHACITDLDGVRYVDKLIEEMYQKKQNLAEIDELIARKTADIWFME
ncbi:MAG: hypothetical protein IJC10_05690 [Clostridia bacterium]|nr:hypothetical protein [Clostridia bacterium]